MESLLLLLSALDVDGSELPRQHVAAAGISPVTEELVGLSEDGLQRMSRPGKVESSELVSLKFHTVNKMYNETNTECTSNVF